MPSTEKPPPELYLRIFFSLIDQIVLKSGQMLIRKDEPSPVQTAAVVDKIVIRGREHIHIHFCQIQLLKFPDSLAGFVKIDILPRRDSVSSGSFTFLLFLISEMIGRSDFRNIVHLLGAQLHLHITFCAFIKKCNMQGPVTVPLCMADIVSVILPYRIVQQGRGAFLYAEGRLRAESPFLQEIFQDICDSIQITDFFLLPLPVISDMAFGHGYDDTVCDQITETIQFLLQFLKRRIVSMVRIIVIDVLHNITVKFCFRTDQGYQMTSVSDDAGEHWSSVEPSNFISPLSPMTLKRDPFGGQLWAVWNDRSGRWNLPKPEESSWQRTPLTLGIGGKPDPESMELSLLENDPRCGYCYVALHFEPEYVLLACCCGGNGTIVLQPTRIIRLKR